MNDTTITFVKTAWHYQNYDDFFRLAELSGYPIIPLSELNPADDSKTYILTPYNGDWQTGFPDARARIIHWDLEWRHKADYPHIPGVAETWASDAWYAMQNGTRYVTLGSHPDLPLRPLPEPPYAPEYDVAFMAYLNPRRALIASQLQALGLKIAPNGWGDARHETLIRARTMVHVHQWEQFKCIAPQRWAIAAAYKLPIISEECSAFDTAHPTFAIAPYNELAEAGHRVTQRGYEDTLHYFAERLYQHLCVDRPFRYNVEAAVEALERFGVI